MRALSLETAAELLDQGVSAAEAAARLEVSERTVQRRWAEIRGTRPAPRPFSEEERARVEELLAEGLSLREISRTLGRTEMTIHRHFPGRGWTVRQKIELANAMRRLPRELRTPLALNR